MNAKLVTDEVATPGISDSMRSQLLLEAQRTFEVIKKIQSSGLSPGDVDAICNIGEKVFELVYKSKDFLAAWKDIFLVDQIEFSHPFMTCVTSLMIARKLDYQNTRTIKAIYIGALIHDIGMLSLPRELQAIEPQEMTPEQFALYTTHPKRGLDMASEFGSIPAASLQIIFQHHECNGKGFPYAISSVKIYPLAKIVCLAERFSRYTLTKKLTPVEALKGFATQKMEILQHEPEMVKALIKAFIKEKDVK